MQCLVLSRTGPCPARRACCEFRPGRGTRAGAEELQRHPRRARADRRRLKGISQSSETRPPDSDLLPFLPGHIASLLSSSWVIAACPLPGAGTGRRRCRGHRFSPVHGHLFWAN